MVSGCCFQIVSKNWFKFKYVKRMYYAPEMPQKQKLEFKKLYRCIYHHNTTHIKTAENEQDQCCIFWFSMKQQNIWNNVKKRKKSIHSSYLCMNGKDMLLCISRRAQMLYNTETYVEVYTCNWFINYTYFIISWWTLLITKWA